MAGAACKIIINNSQQALTSSLEQVLLSPLVRDVMLKGSRCDFLIQAMAHIDRLAYDGTPVPMEYPQCLKDILVELQNEGVITEEVWAFLAR